LKFEIFNGSIGLGLSSIMSKIACDCQHQKCHILLDDLLKKEPHKITLGGVGIVVLNYYPGKGWCILLGKERDGIYKHKYNLAAGKVEGHMCYIYTFIKELAEEFKISIFEEDIPTYFAQENGDWRIFIHNGTPIFVGIFPNISRGPLNKKIMEANKNSSLNWCEREMECVDFFKLDTLQQIDGKNVDDSGYKIKVTSFAAEVVQEVKKFL